MFFLDAFGPYYLKGVGIIAWFLELLLFGKYKILGFA